MKHEIPYHNIIFDLGNVLVRLDSEGCKEAFARLGLVPYLDARQHPEGAELMQKLGLGLLSTSAFCDAVRRLSGLSVTDSQIAEAANTMLVEIPPRKLDVLLALRAQGRRVFLLSNTIDMHWDYCVEKLFPHNGHTVGDYFDQVFLSQRLHLAKPDPRIFEEVVCQTHVVAADTLFIDDLPENCEAARQSVGWHVFHNKGFDDWMAYFIGNDRS